MTTLPTYAHLFPGDNDRTWNVLDAALGTQDVRERPTAANGSVRGGWLYGGLSADSHFGVGRPSHLIGGDGDDRLYAKRLGR